VLLPCASSETKLVWLLSIGVASVVPRNVRDSRKAARHDE
jgi:hypothetical protein